MSYLKDWLDAERRCNPDKFDAAMDRVWFHHRMQLLRLATLDLAEAVNEAAERLDEILS